MPPLVGAVHARARALCTARLVALHASATRLAEGDDDAVRWAFASHLLHEVEQLGPGDFQDAADERETLGLAAECAVNAIVAWLPRARHPLVADECARLLASLDAKDEPMPPEVPPRRIATTMEYAKLWRAFDERWPRGSGTRLGEEVSYAALRAVLAERDVRAVWMLHPMTPTVSVHVDVRLLGARLADGAPAWFPPMPAYVTDERLAWFVYVDDAGAGDRIGGTLDVPEVRAQLTLR